MNGCRMTNVKNKHDKLKEEQNIVMDEQDNLNGSRNRL